MINIPVNRPVFRPIHQLITEYYGTGYVPSIMLDFTSGFLDPRINFSRATNATVTNSAGVITYAPHNLLTYSEQFDNTAWSKTNLTVTANSIAAPDNTTTADKIEATTTASTIGFRTYSSVPSSTLTYSIYAKKGSGATLGNFFNVYNSTTATDIARCSIDYDTGVVTNVIGSGAYSVDAGNGWWRIVLPITSGLTAGNNIILYYGFLGTSIKAGTFFYAWGAQLEIGSTATTYNSTTVKNLLGYSELFDNAAWTKSNSFVQTNSVLYSEDFSNAAWAKSNATVTANSVNAPNGYQTADKIVEDSASSAHCILQTVTTVIGATYTLSFYAKAAEKSLIQFYAGGSDITGNPKANFDLANGVLGTVDAGITASISLVSNDYYRCILTFAAAATSFDILIGGITSTTSARGEVYLGTLGSGYYIWGAQLVQGSVAGDYRRTDAAALPVYYPNHNGVVCAEKLVETTAASATHGITQAVTTSGSANTISVYAKAGERNWVLVGDSTVASARAWFNLSTGVKGTLGVGATSSTMEAVGNGYYRCSVTLTTTAASNTFYIYSATADGAATYTGDGTSGIYIFGAQLSDSASLDSYVLNAAAAPTAAAYYGARFDYDPVTLEAKGLLIEEQRANLLLNSKLDGTDLATQSVTVTAVPHTISFYGTGTVALTGTAIATVVGTGAYPTRTTLTFTPTVGVILFTVTGTVQYAQLEIGAKATSYIPTAASQVTRAADVATIQGSNFYSWYNQNEGTYLIKTLEGKTASGIYQHLMSNNDGTNNNAIGIFDYQGSGTTGVINTNGSTLGVLAGASVKGNGNTIYKISLGYARNNTALGINLNALVLDTSVEIPLVNRLNIGSSFEFLNQWNSPIKSISYYPQRLSDSVLKGLTA